MTEQTTTRTNLRQHVQRLMHSNRREQDGHTYTVPSPDTYPFQWLWDSCYHAIILRHFDIESAKQELKSLFVAQHKNGMLPHMIYWKQPESNNFNWGRDDTSRLDWGKDGVSSITQPPVVALAVEQILAIDDDKQFLSEVFPNLAKFYDYLLKYRVDGSGLAGIINPDESGEDNSPRFDLALGLKSKQSSSQNFAARLELVEKDRQQGFDLEKTRETFWVYDVPFNCFLAENLQIVSHLATKLGLSDDARRFSRSADKLLEAINTKMLDRIDYWPLDGAGSRELRTLSWHLFAPMATGVMSDHQVHSLIHRQLINNDDFLVRYGLRTVGKSDDAYDPEGFWRGPVWLGVNWWLWRGLRRYGYPELALDIQVASLKLLEKSGFREYFNPETGEGLGARGFTWGGLILDMLESNEFEEKVL